MEGAHSTGKRIANNVDIYLFGKGKYYLFFYEHVFHCKGIETVVSNWLFFLCIHLICISNPVLTMRKNFCIISYGF
uniref:Uncharacterized protein n=1 Tax=Anguilla anguilla TaxID=7936 RepID=A0A0E9V7U5_ANGAN